MLVGVGTFDSVKEFVEVGRKVPEGDGNTDCDAVSVELPAKVGVGVATTVTDCETLGSDREGLGRVPLIEGE